ncbi:MAG: hypothetical protein HEQ20_04365 [Aphanizomenon flos-aquae KM1D3_PB]|uniref:hypothetical protein n=1 Tax=Aphanizomenon flos-aquae TaxID=1176 RepID=UPI000542FAAB|nr:hypothetical protein [Aphanizomenon flos-aquae]KHG41265.1 hypothetical protein OA07_12450 [Aphanizomenon flos-aquae 2012/KM1/D3]QSV70141.1 MAG: hypothetical protein HEQ20_04365 [Aphanizomenon flos-aquae KM1D3_PB]
MSETATLLPLNTFISVFEAISDRNWLQFKELERAFASSYGVETWADVLNFRIKPALEPEAKKWLLVQRCSQRIKSIKIINDD